MSLACGKHGWRSAQDPCPACLEELILLDKLVQEKQARWKREPVPAGFERHEGYYGCGRLRPSGTRK